MVQELEDAAILVVNQDISQYVDIRLFGKDCVDIVYSAPALIAGSKEDLAPGEGDLLPVVASGAASAGASKEA